MLKAMRICNSLQPAHKPKIAKEYVFANAISITKNKVRKHNNVYKKIAVLVLKRKLNNKIKSVIVLKISALKSVTFHIQYRWQT
ncbi:conserved hypothetical protein [Tenacibaculum maritimum]|nr:conserved hypothetical protein [Tenacibaculum maritimum]